MGFKKLNSFVILPDNAATRGQIRLINHMVKVEELD
jgi:large subunit ribosomal protein L30